MATLRNWFNKLEPTTGKPTHIRFGREAWDVEWPDVEYDVDIPFSEVPDSVLDREFSDGYGGTNSPSLVAWAAYYVIFSVCYDGAEWLNYVPRRPNAETDYSAQHHGGG